MKSPFKCGSLAWALEYKELVAICRVERRPNPGKLEAGRFTIQRFNGEVTSNYPGYLLREEESN